MFITSDLLRNHFLPPFHKINGLSVVVPREGFRRDYSHYSEWVNWEGSTTAKKPFRDSVDHSSDKFLLVPLISLRENELALLNEDDYDCTQFL